MKSVGKYADIFSDPTFKYLLGEEGKQSMISLLRTFLEIPDIEDIKYLPTEDIGMGKDDKRIHFDLACRTTGGQNFIVEAQVAPQRFFNYRSMLYVSTMIRRAVRESQAEAKKKNTIWNYSFSPVYLLCLFKDTDGIAHDTSDCLHTYRMRDIKTGEDLDTDVSITFVELGKYAWNARTQGVLDQWLYTLKNIQELSDMPQWITDSGIRTFYDKAEVARLPVELREQYQNSIMNELDWINAKIFAVEKAEEKAKAEQTKLIAKKMKENEIPVQTIVECTGLSKEVVAAL